MLRKPVAMPVLSAIQSRNAEIPAVGSLRFRCENIGFSKPPTVRGGLAGTLYAMPFMASNSAEPQS